MYQLKIEYREVNSEGLYTFGLWKILRQISPTSGDQQPLKELISATSTGNFRTMMIDYLF